MKSVMILAVAALAVSAPVWAADAKAAPAKNQAKAAMTLVEARAKIADVAARPSTIKDILGQLSPEDQLAFIKEVNLAVTTLPGRPEEKGETFLVLAHSAMEYAVSGKTAIGGVAQFVAVIFSTTPVEYLPAISESLGNDFFNRGSRQSSTMSASAYMKQAMEVMKICQPVTKQVDNTPVRDTLIIEMFICGGGEDREEREEIRKGLVAACFSEAMQPTVNGWLAEANDSSTASYDGMMAYAGVETGISPKVVVVMRLSAKTRHDAMMADFLSGDALTHPMLNVLDMNPYGTVMPSDITSDPMGGSIPVTTDPNAPWNPTYKRSQAEDVKKQSEPKKPEPGPYALQEP